MSSLYLLLWASRMTLIVPLYFRMGGEEAEIRFCEHKRLNMATLRMTWEAKVQLKEILINSGFPEGETRALSGHLRRGVSVHSDSPLRLLCSQLLVLRIISVFHINLIFLKRQQRLWCSNYNVVYTDINKCFKNYATLGVFENLL